MNFKNIKTLKYILFIVNLWAFINFGYKKPLKLIEIFKISNPNRNNQSELTNSINYFSLID